MRKNVIHTLFILGVVLTACSTKDHFEESSEKEILEFQLKEQIGLSIITKDSIFVTVSDDVYLTGLSDLSATLIRLSDYATVSPGTGDKMDFSSPVPYTVTAEDGSTRTYYVKVIRSETDNAQIPNSSFDFWHETTYAQTNYTDIGKNEEDKTWGTGNQGAAFAIGLGADAELPSQPFQRSSSEVAVQLSTQNMGALAAGFGGKGIAAGNLFAGIFNIGNVTDAHPVFGYPFTETPAAFQIDYQYAPEKGLLDGKLNPVEGDDALDIFVILEKREGDTAKRLGVGWFRSSEAKTEWTTKSVEIKYAQGSAPKGLEDYQTKVLKYGWGGDITVTNPGNMPDTEWGDIGKDNPTHIVVVFTSSYQGDYFIGAPGSTLLIDNFQLIY